MADSGARVTRSTADPLNLKVKHSRLGIRKHFFSQRVIESWNKIPNKVRGITKCQDFQKAYRKLRADLLQSA